MKKFINKLSFLSFRFKLLITITLSINLIFRIINSFNTGFYFDTVNTQFLWADYAYKNGILKFWSTYPGFFDYFPGSIIYLYFVRVISKLIVNIIAGDEIADFVFTLKIFNLFYDLILSIIFSLITYKLNWLTFKQSILVFITIFSTPGLIFISSVWGQFDSLLLLINLITMFLIYQYRYKKRNILLIISGFLYGTSLLIKPTSIIFIPLILFLIFQSYLKNKISLYRYTNLILGFLIAITLFCTYALYDNPNRVIANILNLFTKIKTTKEGAFNIWVLIDIESLDFINKNLFNLEQNTNFITLIILIISFLLLIKLVIRKNLREIKITQSYSEPKLKNIFFRMIEIINKITFQQALFIFGILSFLIFLVSTGMHSRYALTGITTLTINLLVVLFNNDNMKFKIITLIAIILNNLAFSLNQLVIYNLFGYHFTFSDLIPLERIKPNLIERFTAIMYIIGFIITILVYYYHKFHKKL